ncbi:T9SS type A sorting domain-containing protein [Spirosoma luteolum]
MNKLLRRHLCMAGLIVGSSLISPVLSAQTVTMMPNPDNGGGYTDPFNNGSFEPLIEMDNALYGRYVDARGKGCLVKFDGTRLTLIDNPDTNPGVYGNMVAFDHAIYVQYSGNGVGHLAKYDGQRLTLLPNPDNGLGFFGASVLTIFNNGLYGRYLDANNRFRLVRIDQSGTPSVFSFIGITGVTCTVGDGNQRRITFTPQYTGVSGQPITFWVANELVPTTAAGPYTMSVYRDNPVVTLKATQAGTPGEATYAFNWVSSCPLGARRAADEVVSTFRVVAMPNPGIDQSVSVEVNGALGQPLDLRIADERGKTISQLHIEQADVVERNVVRLGATPGIYLLTVVTPNQTQTLKLIRR